MTMASWSAFATIALGKPSGEPVEVVNLGTGEAFSVYELVDDLAQVLAHALHAVEQLGDLVADPAADLMREIAARDRVHRLGGLVERPQRRAELHSLRRRP